MISHIKSAVNHLKHLANSYGALPMESVCIWNIHSFHRKNARCLSCTRLFSFHTWARHGVARIQWMEDLKISKSLLPSNNMSYRPEFNCVDSSWHKVWENANPPLWRHRLHIVGDTCTITHISSYRKMPISRCDNDATDYILQKIHFSLQYCLQHDSFCDI